MATARIYIKGLGPIDGEYDMPEDFNLGELFFIEQTAGIKAGELNEAIKGGSVGLLTCMVSIALKRAGFDVPMGVLWAAKDENIDVKTIDEQDEDEDAGRPLASTPTPSGAGNEPDEQSLPNETA